MRKNIVWKAERDAENKRNSSIGKFGSSKSIKGCESNKNCEWSTEDYENRKHPYDKYIVAYRCKTRCRFLIKLWKGAKN